jgi:hypothetical protein
MIASVSLPRLGQLVVDPDMFTTATIELRPMSSATITVSRSVHPRNLF